MPANLTQQYLKAEKAYKAATTPAERLECLEEMLRQIPKHKGTEKLQADIKRRIAALKKGSGGKGGSSRVDPFHILSSGGGQVVVLGAPNTGKSSLVGALSRARVEISPQPFATQRPAVGMTHYEDAPIQLIDLPPITADYVPPGMMGAARNGDGVLLLCSLGSEEALEEVELARDKCREAKIRLHPPGTTPPAEEELAPGEKAHPALIVGTGSDRPGADDNLAALTELLAGVLPIHPVSTATGAGLEELRRLVFGMLDLIRVYAKEPGKEVDRSQPFLLKRGDRVAELAQAIHKEVAASFKFARIWGHSSKHDGIQVSRDHALEDRDVVEIHHKG